MSLTSNYGTATAERGPGMVWLGLGRGSGPEVLLYISDEARIKLAERGHKNGIDDEVARLRALSLGMAMVKGHVSQYPPTDEDIVNVVGSDRIIDLRNT